MLDGEQGNDWLFGAGGRDNRYGRDGGDDTLSGDNGDDLLFGDAGSNDQCFGNVGYDREVLWLAGPRTGETINSIAGVINLP